MWTQQQLLFFFQTENLRYCQEVTREDQENVKRKGGQTQLTFRGLLSSKKKLLCDEVALPGIWIELCSMKFVWFMSGLFLESVAAAFCCERRAVPPVPTASKTNCLFLKKYSKIPLCVFFFCIKPSANICALVAATTFISGSKQTDCRGLGIKPAILQLCILSHCNVPPPKNSCTVRLHISMILMCLFYKICGRQPVQVRSLTSAPCFMKHLSVTAIPIHIFPANVLSCNIWEKNESFLFR